jgi:hypothetical protein
MYNKFRHIFSFSFKIDFLALAQVIALYLSISCYVRNDSQRVDVMSQSLAEALEVVVFFTLYPLQSHKSNEFTI